MNVQYVPGAGVVLVGPRTVVLLSGQPDGPAVDALWPGVRTGVALDQLLDAAFAVGLSQLGDVALLDLGDGGPSVLVRGDVVVEAHGDALQEVRGHGLRTWREERLSPDVTYVVLRVDTAADGPALPSDGGVLLADRVVVPVPARAQALVEPADVTEEQTDPEPGLIVDPEPILEQEGAEAPDEPERLEDLTDPAPEHEPEAAYERTVSVPTVPEDADAADPETDATAAWEPEALDEALSAPHAPPPSDGHLLLHTGEQVPLDRSVLLGREPRASSLAGDDPRLVTLDNPAGDVSRVHLAVFVRDDRVQVADLQSTNGTLVHPPSGPPLRLTPDVPMTLEPGSAVVLAEGVWFHYQV